METGDCMPDFQLLDVNGIYQSLLSLALGQPIVLLCLPDCEAAAARAVMRSFAELHAAFEPRVNLFAVTGNAVAANRRCAEELDLPYPVLADPEQRLLSLYDVRRRSLSDQRPAPEGTVACVVADANQRIVRMDRRVTSGAHAEAVRNLLESLPREAPQRFARTAPVLIVPEVLDPASCQRLIELHQSGGNFEGLIRQGDGREVRNVVDRDSKIRRDHDITDKAVVQDLRMRLLKRVVPDVAKAFDFQLKHGEAFQIGCYEGAAGGFFSPHRDNVDPSGGRRFAISLNLNAGDYEGGDLRFPEYGPDLYKPPTGAALVFSCRLVHEAMPVTAGRRFVLLTFLH